MESATRLLPIPGQRNVLITSALPYVNNVPHLGNVVGSVLSADVFSRFCKARGITTLFVCGTDEYGTATETKALEEGVTPQELCAKYNKIHTEVYEWFNIGFDIFGRTPTQEQTDIAQDIFTNLNRNGYLEERTEAKLYCNKHNSFLADRFVEGVCPKPGCGYIDARGDQCDKCGNLLDAEDLINPRCKLDGTTPVLKETKHIYLLLDKLQPAVEEWVERSSTKGIWSSNGIKITQSWLNEGLRPRAITRDLKWGTAVPLDGYENKVLYVWFDACIGYVSMTACYTKQWERWWRDNKNVQLYQFMGKDNVPFHTVIFPASQIGTRQDWTQLYHLSTTEYLNYEGGKFSKSRGVGVFGTNAKETGVPSDVWRYYLLSHRPESGDSEFEWKAFIDSNNNELLNNLGNFVNRIIKFINSKIYDSIIPDYTKYTEPDFDERTTKWKSDVNGALKDYITELEAVKLRAALAHGLHLSALGNLLIQQNTVDNKLAAEQPEKCAAIVGLTINLVHLLASVIEPYMPATSASILQQLNLPLLIIPDEWKAASVVPGHKIGKAKHLFTQIKPEKEAEWRELYGGGEAQKLKAEAAAKSAAKKAEKTRQKERKAAGKNGAVEEITNGVGQAALHTS